MEVLVVGLGRFGRLWAECLSWLQWTVWGYDLSLDRAGQAGLNTPIKLLECGPDFHCVLRDNRRLQAVFFCVPISSLKDAVAEIAPSLARRRENPFNSPLRIVDTCSVKVYPRELFMDGLPRGMGHLGLHPMFGPDSVDITSGPESLTGRTLIWCGGEACRPEPLDWQDQFRRLGLRVLQMTAEEHDRQAAKVQGLTHLLGRVLKELGLRPSEMATTGYEALCKIMEQTCNDSWELFLDLQNYNQYTQEMHHALQGALDKVRRLLDEHRERIDPW